MTHVIILSLFLVTFCWQYSLQAMIVTTQEPDKEQVEHNFKDFEDYLLLEDMEETFAERAKRHSRWDEAGNGQGNNIVWEREKDNIKDPTWRPKIEIRQSVVRSLKRSGKA